jgi:hypothetical protein
LRFLHHFPTHALATEARFLLGLSLLEQGRSEEARRALSEVAPLFSGKSARIPRIALSRACFAAGQTVEAQVALESCEGDAACALAAALSRLSEGETKEDYLSCRLYAETHRDLLGRRGEELEAALRAESDLSFRSPWAASTLSILLPGTGQAYAGRWLLGIATLVTEAALCTATAAAGLNEQYGLCTVLGLFSAGLYANNVRLAASLAEGENRRLRREYAVRLRTRFEPWPSGRGPSDP